MTIQHVGSEAPGRGPDVDREAQGGRTMTMTSGQSGGIGTLGGSQSAGLSQRSAGIRRWAWLGIAAQVAFVASWLVAASWQGPRYSVLKHSISEMYAVTAPHPMFLLVVLTLCGAATILFTLCSVWPALRSGGWAAPVGSALLALSAVGLGDLLTPFERVACRMADPGCTTTKMVANSGGKLDGNLTTIGVVLFILAGFFLAHAMRRIPQWRAWAVPARWITVLVLVFTIADLADSGLSGLFERLVSAIGAAALAALAVGILRRSQA